MEINKNCIIRLSRYRSVLYRLVGMGFVRVFSSNLADAVGVSPLQVRKDFSVCSIMGNKKGGYIIQDLIEQLNNILGKNEIHKVILAGVGRIGNALINYPGFEKEGIKIAAAFDIDPSKYSKGDVDVLPLEELKGFVRANNIKIGLIAVPDIAAQQVFNLMLSAGIKGILNFAPIRLRGPEDVIVNNMNVVMELENLIYFVNRYEKSKEYNYENKDS